MKAEEMGAIEARCAATTQGEWLITEDEGGDPVIYRDLPGTAEAASVIFTADWATPEDAAFVVSAHNTDIPALIAEVHHLRTALERFESATLCAYCGLSAVDGTWTLDQWGDGIDNARERWTCGDLDACYKRFETAEAAAAPAR